jgi:hypothetical protein
MSRTVTARISEETYEIITQPSEDAGRSLGESARLGLEFLALGALLSNLVHPSVEKRMGGPELEALQGRVKDDLRETWLRALPGRGSVAENLIDPDRPDLST